MRRSVSSYPGRTSASYLEQSSVKILFLYMLQPFCDQEGKTEKIAGSLALTTERVKSLPTFKLLAP